MAPGTPLSQRPMDLVYFLFFVSHIPFTLILDLQAVYPTWLLPEDSSLRALGAFYVSMTNDPIIGGVAGTFGEVTRRSMQWLLSFTYLEMYVAYPFHEDECPDPHSTGSSSFRPSSTLPITSTTTASCTSSTRSWQSMAPQQQRRLFPALSSSSPHLPPALRPSSAQRYLQVKDSHCSHPISLTFSFHWSWQLTRHTEWPAWFPER
ncbi:hypothetical protein CC1G_09010 [Coprinopsis cinerea okayama7|uniref:EXPERA domain-containing protein n=1 Tax=Coprinopsis cinerea (strain Okayama-7 / 130 / ATCC MYA-4618 / FGSC 9003) TaxID=240176 RepID=A8N9H5_COPC7|nr:hypothetical protein CC1G_09010 [Coprinopsis cinerea okayama7\|eukprot:XP_001831481.2 hypothetical protein CC1G_09010 [Coprinopsis cinerea okayama7\